MTTPAVGDPIPEFSLPATGDKTLDPADFRGRNLVLYFYPKDSTPGCTTEGRDFRDLYPQFQSLDTEIVGVSRDGLKAHENFRRKQDFPFDLISDRDEVLCREFDVIREKTSFGKTSIGVERSTFLIDSNGVLRREWRKVKVRGHAEAVLEAVRKLRDN